jgi:hypothetical protein
MCAERPNDESPGWRRRTRSAYVRLRSPWNHVRPSLSLVQIEFMNVRVASMR